MVASQTCGIALVDRHETNGVEGSNKQIVRHLQTLVRDLRIVDRWSDPIILCLVLFVINDQVNFETGVRPLALLVLDRYNYMVLPPWN